METVHVNEGVRLTHDLPTLWLNRGDMGVVRSIWMSPVDCYEVEFSKPGESPVRTLLNAELLELVEPGPLKARREMEYQT